MSSLSSKSISRFLFAIFGIFILLSTDIFAQSVKREHLYKLRGRDRFEGIRTKNWKPVSGEIKLASLVYHDKKWLENAANGDIEQASIYFYSTIAADIDIEVFNLDMQYFMIPRVKTFVKDWNEFSWPASLIHEVNLPITKLSGVVNGQKGKIYFPLCFEKPTAIGTNSSLKATLIPDKDMTADISLYATSSPKALKIWESQKMESDKPYDFELPVNLLKKGEAYLLKASEQGGREFSYNFQLFDK
ncbi:MAG: hypothetical protein H6695_12405 [Deferribacteres bacterium]|nr:hypothetical protein [candidate division KSB1 bacterium]MCB9510983.1 hypothetical protein [Deferribacteres bacterium]